MKKYSPLSIVSSDDEDNWRCDYSSAFDWTQPDGTQNQRNSSTQKHHINKYKSIFTYTAASMTLDVDYLREGRHKDDYVSQATHCLIIFWCYVFAVVTAPFSAWFYVKRIASNERVILFRLGRLQKIRGPGLTCFLPWIDRFKKIDLRQSAFVIPPQQIIMADGAIIEIGSEIRFRVCDVVKSVTAVKDLDHAVRLLGKTSMINLLQSKKLSELNNEKALISSKLLMDLNVATQPWGIEISLVEFSTPKILQECREKTPVDNILSCLHSAFDLPNTENRQISTENKSTTRPTHTDNDVRSVMVKNIFPSLDKIVERNRQTGAIYEIVVTGDQSATFWIDTKTGKRSEEKAPLDWGLPDVTVKLPDADFLQFVRGNLSPFQAYMSGRIAVNGDAGLLSELQSLIKTH